MSSITGLRYEELQYYNLNRRVVDDRKKRSVPERDRDGKPILSYPIHIYTSSYFYDPWARFDDSESKSPVNLVPTR